MPTTVNVRLLSQLITTNHTLDLCIQNEIYIYKEYIEYPGNCLSIVRSIDL